MASSSALRSRSLVTFVALLLALGAARTARADLTLDQYTPAPTAADGFVLSRPDTLGHLKVGGQLQLDYARDPLVWESRLGDADTVQQKVVRKQLVGHVLASLSIRDRALLFVHLPVNLMMSGQPVPEIRADGAGLGNLRLGARVRLLGQPDKLFGLAVQGVLGVPSSRASEDARLSGESKPTGELGLLADLRPGRAHLTANVGVRLRDKQDTATIDGRQQLTYALGAGYELGRGDTRVEILAELFGASAFKEFGQREQTPLEALGGAKLRHVSGFMLGAAGGAGLTHGYGSPSYRIIGTLGYLQPAERDRDHDGLLDAVDKCVEQPEDRDGFEDEDGCPDPDNDKDGILDVRDKCPTEAEDADGFEDDDGCPDPDNDKDDIVDTKDSCKNEAEDKDGFEDEDGCPDPDNDKDGILDVNDKCPGDAEDKDGFQDDDGCPDPDNDGDGLLDGVDKCPNEAETFNDKQDDDGCPDLIRVIDNQIQILEPVRFAVNGSKVLPASFEMLIEIAAVMHSHPEITLLGVEGHTDSKGNDAKNQKLSDARSNSVRDFLVQSGVDPARIVARGMGETRPIADNATAEGRTQNRRVEFHIGGFSDTPAASEAQTVTTPAPAAPVPAQPATKPTVTP